MNIKYQRYSILLIMAFICSSFNSCQNILETELIGCWTDSYEENVKNPEAQIFRSCDYKVFPPSRFRFSVELKQAGICSYAALSPDDGHDMKDGTWHFDLDTKTVEIFNLKGAKVITYRVLENHKDTLVVVKL